MPRDEEVTQRAGSLRALTGLTKAEWMALLAPFERVLAAYLQDRTRDGHPRTSRRDRCDDNGPLPTMADKLLFILTDLQQHPLQEVQGQRVGMSQSHANTGRHLWPPVLNHALADQALLPARTAEDVTARLTTPPSAATAPAARLFMRGRKDRSNARQPRKSSKRMTVGRRHATRAKTSSGSRRRVPWAS